MSTCTAPVSETEFVFDQLPLDSALTLAVPSVGFDFSKHHVRVAVVCKLADDANAKVRVKLATFASGSLQTALCYAKTGLCCESSALRVHYTGKATAEDERVLATTFEKAAEVKRHDKLQCHSNGAHFLVSSDLPEDQLFHDTNELEKRTEKRTFDLESFKAFFPPKSWESIELLLQNVKDYRKFPLTLSVVGSNNVVCKVKEDGSYTVQDVRCCGSYAIEKMWNVAKPPSCPVEKYEELMKFARSGDRRNVDSLTSEILEFVGFYSMMPRDYPIFNFGKMERLNRDQVKPEDLARSIIGMNADMMFGKALDISMMSMAYQVYFTGGLIQDEVIREEIVLRFGLWTLPGMKTMKFFKTDGTAALGACLHPTQKTTSPA